MVMLLYVYNKIVFGWTAIFKHLGILESLVCFRVSVAVACTDIKLETILLCSEEFTLSVVAIYVGSMYVRSENSCSSICRCKI